MMHWSGSGSSFSSMWCPASRDRGHDQSRPMTDDIVLKRLAAPARTLGVTFNLFEAGKTSDFDDVFARAAREGMQALFVSQSPLFNSHRAEVAALAARVRLPAIYGFREFAEAGGLMSYGANLPAVYWRAARLVDEFSRARGRPICRLKCRPVSS